ERFHIAGEQMIERLFRFPLRGWWRESFHAVEREEELKIHRLFGPERAVVVEYSDAFGGRDVIGRAFLSYFGNEVHDGCFGCAVVPRRKRIGWLSNGRGERQRTKQ